MNFSTDVDDEPREHVAPPSRPDRQRHHQMSSNGRVRILATTGAALCAVAVVGILVMTNVRSANDTAGQAAGEVSQTLDGNVTTDDATTDVPSDDVAQDDAVLSDDTSAQTGTDATAGEDATADVPSDGDDDVSSDDQATTGVDVTFDEGAAHDTLGTMGNAYTMALDANGGEGAAFSYGMLMPDEAASTDTPMVMPECPYTRDGYAFSHWNTQADDSGTSYEAGTTLDEAVIDGTTGEPATAGSSITVYAIWVPASDGTPASYVVSA